MMLETRVKNQGKAVPMVGERRCKDFNYTKAGSGIQVKALKLLFLQVSV